MINPCEINLNKLPSVYLTTKNKLPKKAGIYFVLDNESNVVYVGKTVNFYRRWLQHHRYNQLTELNYTKISYLYVDNIELLSSIEKALINYFKPKLNETRVVTSGTIIPRLLKSPEESRHGKPKYPITTVAIEPELRQEIKELMELRNIPDMTVVINEALRLWADSNNF